MTLITLPSSLRQAAAVSGPFLDSLVTGPDGEPINGTRLLLAIAGNESSFGARREFVRPEAAYAPGGHYYQTAAAVRALWTRWGVLAASSFGSWQVMFVTATELGFTGHPLLLQRDDVTAPLVEHLIRDRFIGREGAKTIRDVLDAYNSGNPTDRIVPTTYIADGVAHYRALAAAEESQS